MLLFDSDGDNFLNSQSFYRSSLTVYLAKSEFYGNSAYKGSGLYFGEIAGIGTTSNEYYVILQQCILHGNIGEYGSGIYVSSSVSMYSFRMSVKDLISAGNIAYMAGGAIYIHLMGPN